MLLIKLDKYFQLEQSKSIKKELKFRTMNMIVFYNNILFYFRPQFLK